LHFSSEVWASTVIPVVAASIINAKIGLIIEFFSLMTQISRVRQSAIGSFRVEDAVLFA